MLTRMLLARGFLLIALVLSTLVPGPPGHAETAGDEIHLKLIGQPLWHRPGDELALRLQIENNSAAFLDGFVLRIEGHERSSSRSALHQSFAGDPGFFASSFPEDFSDVEIDAGSTRSVFIDAPIEQLASLANTTEGGVYPLTISLFDASAQLLDALTTPIIYYPARPEIPLGLVLTLPLNEVPSRGPTGIFEARAADAGLVLEEALTEDGWVTGLLDALNTTTTVPEPPERRPARGRSKRARKARTRPPPRPPRELHLALAPIPRFVEELADMADGYEKETDEGPREVKRGEASARAAAEALDTVAQLLGRPHVQPLLTPYSFPDLPAVDRGLPLEGGMIPQLSEARSALSAGLGVDLESRWIFPPAGRLDATTLEDLQESTEAMEHLFISEESFEVVDPSTSGCPTPSPSFTCPVTVRTTQGSVTGFITDEGLQTRFAALSTAGDDRLDLQNLLAETAMIREETPGVASRVVQATVPSLWHPQPAMSELFLDSLQQVPWIKTLTPDEALQTAPKPQPRNLQTTISGLASQPSADLFTAIAQAQDFVESFKLLRPPVGIVQRLNRNLLVAQSRLWGSDPILSTHPQDFVDATLSETQSEFNKVTVGGIEEIRLTSRRGEIPIEIFNEADYDVTVNVRVFAPELRLNETIPEVLRPGRFHQLTVDVIAGSSGIFPLEVSIETPDGREIDSKSITVRSTEFNQVALIITIGALAFLVLFYLLRGIRRREQEAGATA